MRARVQKSALGVGDDALCYRVCPQDRRDRCLECPAMTQLVTSGLLWFCAIGCGLLAGVYFAFSTFIMTALSRIDQAHGVAAMNSVNSTILRSPFIALFFGTTLASLVLAVIAPF